MGSLCLSILYQTKQAACFGAKETGAVKEQRLPGIAFCCALWPLVCSFPAHVGSQGSWSFIYRLSNFEKKKKALFPISVASCPDQWWVKLSCPLKWGRSVQWKERKELVCVRACAWVGGEMRASLSRALDSFKRAAFLCEKQLPQYLSCNLLTPDGMGKCTLQLLAGREAAVVMRNLDKKCSFELAFLFCTCHLAYQTA